MSEITIAEVRKLLHHNLEPLISASGDEGYEFVQRLWNEYENGTNRFDTGGGVLYAANDDNAMVAIGGIHPDPYLNDPKIRRVRHLYVLPDYRRHGLGGLVMRKLISHSQAHFHTLTLRTLTEHGDKFYKSLAFNDEKRFDQATHWLKLTDTS